MHLGNRLAPTILCGLVLLGAACSSGGSSGTPHALSGATQNLTLDPTGHTTVLTFPAAPPAFGAAQVQASAGQAALSVVAAGTAVTVTWNGRVTPSHQVRVVGVEGVSSAWMAVATSDDSAPAFTITGGVQTPGLGGDQIELVFSGPNVAPETATDAASWNLVVNGQSLVLTGAVLDLDPAVQTLTMTLPPTANLFATFTLAATGVTSVADVPASSTPVAGAATGDTTPPTLLSAVQNLAADEYGRVVDFTFDEAMDPISSVSLARFSVPSPNVPIQVQQPGEDVLRVTFAGPVIPGVHEVTLTGLLDAHGNPLPNGPTAVTQPAPVANAFDGDPEAVTVQNSGGDYVTLTTLQAFDVASAEDPASWTLEIDGSGIDLALQTLTYDFLSKTLVIELSFDMTNGVSFTVAGNGVLEVDGQTFLGDFTGSVAGDDVEPTVVGVVQNRNVDPSGRTLQVTFSEDVLQGPAESIANYVLSDPTVTVLGASLLPNKRVVRLSLDSVAVPGAVTITVEGISDLAGNVMSAPQAGIAITSTDTTPPSISNAMATAVEGANNDTVVVSFNDDMVQSDVLEGAYWSIQSPVGTELDTAGCTIVYDAGTRTATLTFDANWVNLKRGDDFRVQLSTMRDIAGNAITATAITGDVQFERDRPEIVTLWRDALDTNELVLRFSEPCDHLGDLYDPAANPTGTRYVLRDGAVERGRPLAATVLDDGLGVRLTFGFLVSATDTLDVYGIADLAGNYLFPAFLVPIQAEDPTIPSFDTGISTLTALSGEANDEVSIVFDVPMSPWRLLDPSSYTISTGGQPLALDGADFSFDGDRTVTVRFGAGSNVDLQASALYDLTVNDVQSAQGIARTVADTEPNVPVGGDAIGPVVGASDVRLDPQDASSLLVFADEALDESTATDATLYDYDSGTLATSAVRLSPRVVRLTFPVVVAAGNTLDFTLTDLAGNNSGALSRVVTVADTQPPLLAGVEGVSVSGFGGDYLRVSFNEPVDFATALDLGNYSVTNGAAQVDLSGASPSWVSSTLTVVIALADGVALNSSASMSFTVSNVADWSGNAIASPGVTLGGSVTGDTTPPDVTAGFVNWREDAGGLVVDVLFSEDVTTSFSGDPLNWSASGGQSVLDAEVLEHDSVRLWLSAPLGAGDELQLAGGLSDPAGNTAGAISFEPAR